MDYKHSNLAFDFFNKFTCACGESYRVCELPRFEWDLRQVLLVIHGTSLIGDTLVRELEESHFSYGINVKFIRLTNES